MRSEPLSPGTIQRDPNSQMSWWWSNNTCVEAFTSCCWSNSSGNDQISCDFGGEAASAVSQLLSDSQTSSLHQILPDIHHVVSRLPKRRAYMQHHLTTTLWLREVGWLCYASGESHEYLMKGKAGMMPDWTGVIFSLRWGLGLKTGAFWQTDPSFKAEIRLINITVPLFLVPFKSMLI